MSEPRPEPEPTTEPDAPRWRRWVPPLAIFTVVMVAMVATINGPGLTWDEPAYRYSELYMQEWFEALFEAVTAAQRSALFSPAGLHYYWRYNRYGPNFHPPLAGMFANLNWLVFHHVMGDYAARRMASAILFALTVSSLFVFVRARYGLLGAWGAAASLALTPRVFGHAHLAGTDVPTMAVWWFTFLAFVRALDSRTWRVGFGVLLGLCFLTKFTAVLVLVPCVVWAAIYPRRRTLWTLLTGVVVAPLVAVALNPTWWHHTLTNLRAYIDLVLVRKDYLPDIEIFYWGRQYVFSLPPMNAYVLMGITIPVGILVAGAIGMVLCVCRPRRDPMGLLVMGQLLLMPVVRMWPGSPGHDGVRLFLVTFVFYALCAGRGLAATAALFTRPTPLAGALARVLVVTVLVLFLVLPPLVSTVQYHPYYLSYYNEAIGGVRGAFYAGFEPTYWYDACDQTFLDWMNANLPRGAYVTDLTVCDALGESQSLGRLRGDLRIDVAPPRGTLPYDVLLTHTSKVNDFRRLLFAMAPVPGSERRLRSIPLVGMRTPRAHATSWTLLLLVRHRADLGELLRTDPAAMQRAMRMMRDESRAFDKACAGLAPPVAELARAVRRIPFGGGVGLERMALSTANTPRWRALLQQQFLPRIDYVLADNEDHFAAALHYLAAVWRVFEYQWQDEPEPVRVICRAQWLAPGQTMHERTPIVDPAHLQDPEAVQRANACWRQRIVPGITRLPPPAADMTRRLVSFCRVYDHVELLRSLDPRYEGRGPARLLGEMAARLDDAQVNRAVAVAAESVRRLVSRAAEAGPRVQRIVGTLSYPLTWVDLEDLLVHHWGSACSAVDILAGRWADVQKVLQSPRYLLPHEYGGYLDTRNRLHRPASRL